VTSCDLAEDGTLFVTTAFDGMSPEARGKAPQSGAIFKCQYITEAIIPASTLHDVDGCPPGTWLRGMAFLDV
jgi:hypothetical protein